jgi:hypothetical protein
MVKLDSEAFEYATKRIEAFAKVQQGREWSEQLNAVGVLLPSLGFDEDMKDELHAWLSKFIGPDYKGEIMLGLLIGLFIHQYQMEEGG